jgi:hypothetical protein
MELFLIELEPFSDYIASYLLEVRGNGSAFIWLLESTGGYKAYTLTNEFDFVNKPEASWIVSDLNGDKTDGDEVALYFSNPPDSDWLAAPKVFNLGQTPPRPLEFIPDMDIFNVGMEFSNYWAVGETSPGKNGLVFQTTVFPACPTTIHREYQWNGEIFELSKTRYEVEPDPNTFSFCRFIVDHAEEVWGPQAAIPIMESILPGWPPPKDEAGKPYPFDAKDEWRYRLGVNHALLGDFSTASNYFKEIISDPSYPNSRWIPLAEEFLDTYMTPEDVYNACVNSPYCMPSYAIEYLVDILTIEEFQNAIEFLWQFGVGTLSSGYFDFDGDDDNERWFTVRHRSLEQIEFWILAANPEGGEAIMVEVVQSNPPSVTYLEDDYVSEEALGIHPVVFLESSIAFSMQRIPGTQEAYILWVPLRKEYPNRFFEGLDAAENALFSGVDPSLVRDDLLALQEYPGLLCQTTWSCDSYYYLLGLVNELVGNERAAVDAYHRLWWDYSRSPYTIMARLKIDGGVVAPTLTLTSTGTVDITPTVSGTPPTVSPTLSTTLTPTLTLSPTISQTPDPYP